MTRDEVAKLAQIIPVNVRDGIDSEIRTAVFKSSKRPKVVSEDFQEILKSISGKVTPLAKTSFQPRRQFIPNIDSNWFDTPVSNKPYDIPTRIPIRAISRNTLIRPIAPPPPPPQPEVSPLTPMILEDMMGDRLLTL